MRPTTILQAFVAALVLALATVGCTADGGDLEGKKCDISKPRDQQCINGYSCSCDGGDVTKCFCHKTTALTQGLSQPPRAAEAAPQLQFHAQPIDPSARLLRRLYGIELAPR